MRTVLYSAVMTILLNACSACDSCTSDEVSVFTAAFQLVSVEGVSESRVVDDCFIPSPIEVHFRDTFWTFVENIPRPESQRSSADSSCWHGEVVDSGFYHQSADTLLLYRWQSDRAGRHPLSSAIVQFFRGDYLVSPGWLDSVAQALVEGDRPTGELQWLTILKGDSLVNPEYAMEYLWLRVDTATTH